MKRTLTALLTFALVGSLFFMGAAGSAAAQDGLVDVGSDVDVNQSAESGVLIETNQSNDNSQVQFAGAAASSDKSTAKTAAAQQQSATQTNENTVTDVTAASTNNATTDASTGVDINVTADIGLPPGLVDGGPAGA